MLQVCNFVGKFWHPLFNHVRPTRPCAWCFIRKPYRQERSVIYVPPCRTEWFMHSCRRVNAPILSVTVQFQQFIVKICYFILSGWLKSFCFVSMVPGALCVLLCAFAVIEMWKYWRINQQVTARNLWAPLLPPQHQSLHHSRGVVFGNVNSNHG